MWLAIFNVAKALGQKVVAEGVERPEQAAYLRKLGCHEFQGFLLAHPMPADDLEDWMTRRTESPVHALGTELEERLRITA